MLIHHYFPWWLFVLQVTDNGVGAFSNDQNLQKQTFPSPKGTIFPSNTDDYILAPFWADVDGNALNNETSNVFYQVKHFHFTFSSCWYWCDVIFFWLWWHFKILKFINHFCSGEASTPKHSTGRKPKLLHFQADCSLLFI